jgi:two-component system response regulator DesR
MTARAPDHGLVIAPQAAGSRRYRVLVVDADHRVRTSLANLLGLGDRLEVVGQAGQAGEALQCCEALDPDVIVVDPRLPDVDGGSALISVLRQRSPDCRVLILAWSALDGPAVLASGADGLLPKSLAPTELIDRVVQLAEAPRGASERRESDARAARPDGPCAGA